MKIRQGFVSNSSSSSFTGILRKTDYDVVVSSLSEEYYREQVLENPPQQIEVGGETIVMVNWADGNYADCCMSIFNGGEIQKLELKNYDYDKIYKPWSEFLQALEKKALMKTELDF